MKIRKKSPLILISETASQPAKILYLRYERMNFMTETILLVTAESIKRKYIGKSL